MPGRELEGQVDHLRAVVGRPADALGDRHRVALAVAVEHADRHQLGPVGQPGHADRVARALGDRPRDVGAVAVLVVGVGVVVHEVVAVDEPDRREVGRAAEAGVAGVGDAGVQHGDDHALAAGAPDVDQVLPGVRRVHAQPGQEVPLQRLPAARHAAGAGIGRDEARRARDVARRGAQDVRPAAQSLSRGRDALAGAQLDHPGQRLVGAAGPRSVRPRVADHHFAGLVRRLLRARSRGRRLRQWRQR